VFLADGHCFFFRPEAGATKTKIGGYLMHWTRVASLAALVMLLSLGLFTIGSVDAGFESGAYDDLSASRFLLQANGVIEGQVYASDGITPLANVGVTIDGMEIGTCTDVNGGYILIVPLGSDYYVRAGGASACDGGNYVPEWWRETSTVEQAVAINLDDANPAA
jgi:hypothetical protein